MFETANVPITKVWTPRNPPVPTILYKSIKEYGLLSRIFVAKDIDNTYVIVDGAQRYHAACDLNLSKVPVMFRD